MINIFNVVTAIVTLVNANFKPEPTPESELEKELARNLFNIVCDVVNNCEIVHEETLVLDKRFTPKDVSEASSALSQQLSQGASSQSTVASVTSTYTLSDEILIDNLF